METTFDGSGAGPFGWSGDFLRGFNLRRMRDQGVEARVVVAVIGVGYELEVPSEIAVSQRVDQLVPIVEGAPIRPR